MTSAALPTTSSTTLGEGCIDLTGALHRKREFFFSASCIAALFAPLALLAYLFASTIIRAWPRLSWDFLVGVPSRKAHLSGVAPALVGSIYLMVLTAVIAIPIGVGAALYLEEYAPKNRFTSFLEINISNLAGVPSILYGLLGLEVFVRTFALDRSLLAGAATLALLLLPMIITVSRESLRAVPGALREAGFALGGDRWQTLQRVVLPLAFPNILTGVILSLSRAIGETAPLIAVGAIAYVTFLPDSIMSPFTALPIQIFNWISRPQPEFHQNAAAGIMVLMTLLVLLNTFAVWLRVRYQRRTD